MRRTAPMVLVAALATFAGPLPGQVRDAAAQQTDADESDIQQRLSTIERDLQDGRSAVISLERQTTDLAAEINALRVQIGAASRAAQRYALDIDELDAELSRLVTRETAASDDLIARRAALAATLAGLQRLSLRPQAALLVTPGDPNDVVRSGLLLRRVVPAIERQATELRQQLAALTDLRQDIASRRDDLDRTRSSLDAQRQQLASLRTEKTGVLDRARGQRDDVVARLDSLAGEADSLEELLAQLQQQAAARAAAAAAAAAAAEAAREAAEQETAAQSLARATPRQSPQSQATVPLPPAVPGDQLAALAPPGIASIADARGALTQPALGKLVQLFGDPTDFGSKSDGIVYSTSLDALVVAPWDGQIVFADRFRTFGQIVIIDHGEGYHSLLAGLGRIDAPVGQWVLAGEPVGVAGNSGGDAATEPTGEGPQVYVEFRRDGKPINPLPWIAASTDKVSG